MTFVRIPYVEDNADIREMGVELLEAADRCVVACADAEMAWQQLQTAPFDVLVTDASLPDWSGTELARRWLLADASRWVILFSGYDFESGLASLGTNVRAIRKENFEQLDSALQGIRQHLQREVAAGSAVGIGAGSNTAD